MEYGYENETNSSFDLQALTPQMYWNALRYLFYHSPLFLLYIQNSSPTCTNPFTKVFLKGKWLDNRSSTPVPTCCSGILLLFFSEFLLASLWIHRMISDSMTPKNWYSFISLEVRYISHSSLALSGASFVSVFLRTSLRTIKKKYPLSF